MTSEKEKAAITRWARMLRVAANDLDTGYYATARRGVERVSDAMDKQWAGKPISCLGRAYIGRDKHPQKKMECGAGFQDKFMKEMRK